MLVFAVDQMDHDIAMMQETQRVIDLRSDTVTRPTPAMREAMAQAEVGDDVFGDDPTVKELEAETAVLLGKESALYTPSGTMANQLAIRGHTEPGDEILVEANAHLYYYESGAPAVLSGVMCRCLNGQRGIFTGADIEAALRPADQHFPRTRLVCLENTHNRGGGKIWPIQGSAGGGRQRQAAWAVLAFGWRPVMERVRGHGDPGTRICRAFRHRERLLFQGARGARRFGAGGAEGPHGTPASIPEDVRWWDATGWNHCRRRAFRPPASSCSARRGPWQRPDTRYGTGLDSGTGTGPRRNGNQHGQVPRPIAIGPAIGGAAAGAGRARAGGRPGYNSGGDEPDGVSRRH